jgi:hypothetical protein
LFCSNCELRQILAFSFSCSLRERIGDFLLGLSTEVSGLATGAVRDFLAEVSTGGSGLTTGAVRDFLAEVSTGGSGLRTGAVRDFLAEVSTGGSEIFFLVPLPSLLELFCNKQV